MRLQAGTLILPPDGQYSQKTADKLQGILATVIYLDSMGFDSFHPPVWDSAEPIPDGAKQFRYTQVIRYVLYLSRRYSTTDNCKPVRVFELKHEARKYMSVSKTLAPLIHPWGTYGELTLAAMLIGLTVVPNTNPRCSAKCYSPIIYVGEYLPAFRPRGGCAP